MSVSAPSQSSAPGLSNVSSRTTDDDGRFNQKPSNSEKYCCCVLSNRRSIAALIVTCCVCADVRSSALGSSGKSLFSSSVSDESMRHVDEQPSPETRLPSSHSSPGPTVLSAQMLARTGAPPSPSPS